MISRPSRFRTPCIISFGAAYLIFQITMIILANFNEDKRLGFWMFAESSNFKTALFREMENGQRIRVKGGVWEIRDRSGEIVRYSWSEMVQEFHLGYLERATHAKTGMAVTLKYLQHALDWVMQRIPADRATKRLHLYVQYSKAGGPLEELWLSSKPREP